MKVSGSLPNATRSGYSARLSFGFTEFMNNASDKLYALQKVVHSNIFVWSMGIRARIADAEGCDGRGITAWAIAELADDFASGALPSSIISISLKPRTSRCSRKSSRTSDGVRSGTKRKSSLAIAVLGSTVFIPASVCPV